MALLRRVAMLLAAVVLLLRFSTVHGIYEGVLECEELTPLECAFSVSSAGARCVLEKSTLPNGDIVPSCQTSPIMAERLLEWIESDECIQGCGLERETYGLSTDGLLEAGFVDKLCSAECQNNCPNIIDIYVKLAAGEGVYLPRLCNEQKFKARRLIDYPARGAQNGLEGRGGGRLESSTYMNNHESSWDSSLASVGTASPQPSPVYGPVPAPVLSSPRLKKGKKPVSISPSPSPPPSLVVAPAPVPSPSPLVYEVSSTRFGDDFEVVEY